MTAADTAAGGDRPRCGGKRKNRPECCRRPAGWGTDHPGIGRCKLHGGSTPSHQASARAEQARRTEAEALAALARLDLPPMTDPLTALGRLAAESVAWLELLREQVAQLESVVGPDHQGDERIRGKVLLMERGMDRAQKFAGELARLNLDERIAGMHALVLVRQGELMAGLVRAILARLGLTAGQWELVGQVVPEEFRALDERGDGG